MTILTYVRRSLLKYWKSHVAEAAGIALATAVTVGALGVGDSARSSLRAAVERRLGAVEFAAFSPDAPFSARLADGVSKSAGTAVSAVLTMPCSIIALDGKIALPGRIYGIDADFAGLSGRESTSSHSLAGLRNGEAVASGTVAEALSIGVGDLFTVVVGKPGFIPRELAFADDSASSGDRLLLKTAGIAPTGDFAAEFSLSASGTPPLNVFVPRSWLSAKLAERAAANALLAAAPSGKSNRAETLERLNSALKSHWSLADMGLMSVDVGIGSARPFVRVASRSIFIADDVAERLLTEPGAMGVYTYFVNSITAVTKRGARRSCPYSFISGVPPGFPGMSALESGGIILNEWLAEDIGAGVGDEVELEYFLPENLKRLRTAKHAFKVVAIKPMSEVGGLSWLTPEYPGLTDVDNCADWRPSLPIDTTAVRPEDEKYWRRFGPTPKAFILLDQARLIWRNRYGSLTAALFPKVGGGISGSDTASYSTSSDKSSVLRKLDPADFAPEFADVAARAEAGAENSVDFGALFMGLSFFIIAAALILTWMLLGLAVEARSREIAILAKTGFPSGRVTSLLALEHSTAALAGVLAGVPFGTLYCHGIVVGLRSFWSGAVGTSSLAAEISWSSILVGGAANLAAGAAASYFVSRSACARYHSVLIDAERPSLFFQNPGHWRGIQGAKTAWAASAILAVAGLAVAAAGGGASLHANPAVFFFVSGFLILLAAWSACYALLRHLSNSTTATARSGDFDSHLRLIPHLPVRPGLTFVGLAARNVARRPSRSLASVVLLSLGMFLTFAVVLNRRGGGPPTSCRSSGAGGFELFVTLASPISDDPNTSEGRAALRLDEKLFENVEFINMRLREGDEASCLNLNSAVEPAVLGAPFRKFAELRAFEFAALRKGLSGDAGNDWAGIAEVAEPRRIPQKNDCGLPMGMFRASAVADDEVITWSLKKKLGEGVSIKRADGKSVELIFEGALKPSVFQGYVLIDESDFGRLFGDGGGIRVMLVDCPEAETAEIASALRRSLGRFGAVVETCGSRLSRFRVVENTYLSIFLALGGLGLLVGCVGFGVLAARTAVERRLEFLLLGALGFSARRVKTLLILESAAIAACGLAAGIVAAGVAGLPAVLGAGGASASWTEPALVAAGIALAAFVAILIAAELADFRR